MIATIELQNLNRDLAKIGKELNMAAMKIPGEITKELIIGANEIRNTMIKSMQKEKKTGRIYRKSKNVQHQASAPGEPPAVDSGELLRSIMFDVHQFALEIGVAGGAPYAEALEFGTKKMQPRPFLNPAVEKHKQDIIDAVGDGVFEMLSRSVGDNV
jgi:HK97 gp10 family phage protein